VHARRRRAREAIPGGDRPSRYNGHPRGVLVIDDRGNLAFGEDKRKEWTNAAARRLA
jgi:hypothetical protein